MIILDDLTWAGNLVFDDLGAAAVAAVLQQADVTVTLTADAAQEVASAYEQLFDPELVLSADAAQEFVSPTAPIAYLQSANVQLIFFTDAFQEHIPVAGGELGQTSTVVIVLTADAYQQYVAGANPGDALQQADALLTLSGDGAQSYEAVPVVPPGLPVYLQISDAQVYLTANTGQEFVLGSLFQTSLAEFFDELFMDELSDMFIGNRNAVAETRPKLIPLMNAAMTYAYAKWECGYASTILSVVEGQSEYVLRNEYLLQVIQLVNVYGLEIPSSEYQVLGQTIYFPYPRTQDVEVIYRTKHVRYTLDQNDAAVRVALPEMLMPWLKAYVCYRYFASMKTESAMVKAADFLAQAAMYENLFVQTNTTNEFTAPINDKMAARGFA